MDKPWEKYKKSNKPWEKYSSPKPASPLEYYSNEDPGYLESSLRSLEQGATLGWGDEINSLLASLASGKSYDEELADSRSKFKAAEEAHPYLSLAGNLVGSVPLAVATSGMGLIPSGIAMGAAGALGSSESGNVGTAIKETVLGGAIGGAGSAAMGKAIETIGKSNAAQVFPKVAKGLGNWLTGTEVASDTKEAIKMGLNKISLTGPQALAREVEAGDLPAKYKQMLSDILKSVGGMKEKALNEATPINAQATYDDIIAAIENKINSGVHPDDELMLKKFREQIDAAFLGSSKKASDAVKKQLQAATQENTNFAVDRTLAQKAEESGVRTYEAYDMSGKVPYEPREVKFRTKDGKLAGSLLDPVAEAKKKLAQFANKEIVLTEDEVKALKATIAHGFPMNAESEAISKRFLNQSEISDAMETAQRMLEAELQKKNLPYIVQDVIGNDGNPAKVLINTLTMKRVGNAIPLEDILPQFDPSKMSAKQLDSIAKELWNTSQESANRSATQRMASLSATGVEKAAPAEKALFGDNFTGVKKTLARGVDSSIIANEEAKLGRKLTEEEITKLLSEKESFQQIQTAYGSLKRAEEVLPEIENIYAGDKLTSAGSKAKKLFEELESELTTPTGKYGNTELQKMMESLQDLPKESREYARFLRLRGKIKASEMAPGLHSVLGNTPKALWYGGANIAGLGARVMYDASPELVKNIATNFLRSADKTAQELGRVLSQTANKDKIGRNALLFALEQNPAYRQMLHDAFGAPEHSKK